MSEPAPEPPVNRSTSSQLSGRVGRYEIRHMLGRGAMGVVYLAFDTVLEREVALKVMAAGIADDVQVYERFAREAKAVAKMTHPNVVMVFDLGHHDDGSPYIAMELLKGQDLSKALRTPPGLALERKLNIVLQVLAALAHAHEAGIVHRDIKPANIFLTHEGSVKLMDFGVARLTTASLTGTGTIVGTADYMSPEQVRAMKVDGRSDVFSLGCVLYEMLVGRRPFHSDELIAIFYKIVNEPPDLTLLGPAEQALAPVLRKAMAKDLAERYTSADDFAADLRRVMPSLSLTPEPTVTVARPAGGLDATLQTQPSTARGMAPTARGMEATTAMPSPTVPGPRPRAVPAAAPRKPMALYAGIGAGVLALAALAGTLVLRSRPAPSASPLASPAAGPTAAPSAAVTLAPPVSIATPAPPPTFGEVSGEAAPAMRAGQSAFKAGDYAKAAAQARAALAKDPASRDARALLDRSGAGERALASVAAAETALRQGDHRRALAAAQAAREQAPWDARASDVLGRVQEAQRRALQEAQQQAQQQKDQAAAQVNGLIAQAESALNGQKYDDAIAAYDKALALDSSNSRALQGKSGAIAARAIAQASQNAQAAGPGRPAGRGFAPGKTVGHSAELSGGAVPEGFAETPGVSVQRTQAAELPGKIMFQVEPESVSPGQAYKIRIFLFNEGAAPIQIRDMVVGTKLNGRQARGPVPPLAKDVAPRQKALLREIADTWKQEVDSWSMEVLVRTTRGEAYTNQLTWK